MQKVEKRSFSLLEVLISFILSSFILYFLMTTLFTTLKLSHQFESIKKSSLEKALCYERLLNLFSSIIPSTIHQEDQSPYLVTFEFENGLDPQLLYSGKVQGALLLEKETLFLVTWPHQKKAPLIKEPLYSPVKEVLLQLYLPHLVIVNIEPPSLREALSFPFFLPPEKYEPYCLKEEA